MTMAVTSNLIDGFAGESAGTVDLMDLHAEGFDPLLSAADLAFYRDVGTLPEDIKAIHDRLDRADSLAFVFPMYWWSVPGLLKSWFDRVLTRAWAYDYSEDGKLIPLLTELPVLVIAVAATDEPGYQKHGYQQAFETQIKEGIFRACGLTDVHIHVLFESEAADDSARLQALANIAGLGRQLSESR